MFKPLRLMICQHEPTIRDKVRHYDVIHKSMQSQNWKSHHNSVFLDLAIVAKVLLRTKSNQNLHGCFPRKLYERGHMMALSTSKISKLRSFFIYCSWCVSSLLLHIWSKPMHSARFLVFRTTLQNELVQRKWCLSDDICDELSTGFQLHKAVYEAWL